MNVTSLNPRRAADLLRRFPNSVMYPFFLCLGSVYPYAMYRVRRLSGLKSMYATRSPFFVRLALKNGSPLIVILLISIYYIICLKNFMEDKVCHSYHDRKLYILCEQIQYHCKRKTNLCWSGHLFICDIINDLYIHSIVDHLTCDTYM